MRLLALLFFSFEALAQGLPGGERVTFGEIFGTLYRPAVAGKAPAIVIVHGSGGVTVAREGFWASELAQAGMVALVTDSFTPRGVSTTVEDQTRVGQAQMLGDAYAALAFLSALPEVDAGRVAVMGFSKGGTTALLSADQRTQGGDRAFAAHIPLYPGCNSQYRNPRTGAPVLVLIGAEDNYVGVKSCAAYVERLRAAGAPVQIKTYPGAHHGFDGDLAYEREFFLGRAENYRDCVLFIEDDGRFVDAKSGETLAPQAVIPTWRRSCMTRGATVAANRKAKMAALQDVKDFLKTTLFH
jgi:dienelactone hydrolase